MELDAIAIVGPTASGKTKRAVSLSKCVGGEIISADSRQVYRGMTIGTGKDLAEYEDVPYHLIDIAPAGSRYNLFKYLADFNKALREIRSRGNTVVVCGGTGMYVENALNGIQLPEVPQNDRLRADLSKKTLNELTEILKKYKVLHNTTDVDSCKRAIRAIEIEEYYLAHPETAQCVNKNTAQPLKSLVIGVDIPREERRAKISARLRSRLEEGMIDEVQGLLDSGIAAEDLIYYGLEYKFVTQYIIGDLTYQEMYNGLETAIHQFAKRQMTWFRGMEKRGIKINWLPWNVSEEEFNNRVISLIR